MTLPKLLFALNQKGVTLHEGKRGRIRFNPRDPVSPAMKAAIREHKPALLELLAGGDLEDWRRVRVRKPEDPPEDGGDYLDDGYEETSLELIEEWHREDLEADRDMIANSERDDLGIEPRFVFPSPDRDDDDGIAIDVPF